MKHKITCLIVLFLFCVFQTSSQTPEFPATAGGKRAALFVQMLGSKDDAALKEFINGSMTPNAELSLEQRVERFRNIRADMAGAKLVKVLSASEENIQFIVELPAGEARKIRMGFTEDAEKRIAGFRSEPFDKNAQSPLAEAELVPSLENYLAKQSHADKFSGVVLVAKNGKPVFAKAYGFADREKKIPNRVDTKFNIGSENKIFTQLAIGILADEGKLSLSDTIGKHLPDYPNKEAAAKVTIEQLVAMRSGIGDIFNAEYDAADKNKIRTIKDYFPLFAAKPLLFPPGTSSRYSNGGYIVLGAIIEKASGKSYYDFVRERIFKPAGMNDTDSYEMDAKVPNLAEGYTREITPGELLNNRPLQPARGSSAGGGYSTAEDLLRFANALETGALPTPKSMKDSTDPIVRMIAGGLGIAGGSPGVNATLSTRMKFGYTVIVMANMDEPSAEEVSRQIRIWIGAN